MASFASSTTTCGARKHAWTNKVDFQANFDFLQPEFGHGRLGHPQSLEYLKLKHDALSSGCLNVSIHQYLSPPAFFHRLD